MWKKTFKAIHELLCFVGHPVFTYHGILLVYICMPTNQLLIEATAAVIKFYLMV